MMAFAGMLVDACEKAGMKYPPTPDDENSWDKKDFPHFFIFCRLQLGRAIEWGEHWENAEVIAAIPEEKLKTMTFDDFIEAGFRCYR